MPLGHRERGAANDNLGGCGLRQERAHFPARLRIAFLDNMRSEHAKRVAVITPDYGFDIRYRHASLILWQGWRGGTNSRRRNCTYIWRDR